MLTPIVPRKSKWEKYKYQILGSFLTFLSILVIAYILELNGRATPLSALNSVLFGIISIGLQTLAAFIFSKRGKADPALARTAINQLMKLIQQINTTKRIAESGFENKSRTNDKSTLGILSARLSAIEDQTINAADIWKEFHPDAYFELEGETE